MYVCIHTYIHTYIHIQSHIHKYVCICMYVYSMYVYVCILTIIICVGASKTTDNKIAVSIKQSHLVLLFSTVALYGLLLHGRVVGAMLSIELCRINFISSLFRK